MMFTPEWQPDTARSTCVVCNNVFSFFMRRHHCRACGNLVCADCSPHYDPLPAYGYDDPVRICNDCKYNGYSSSSDSGDVESSEEDEDVLMIAASTISSRSTSKYLQGFCKYFVKSEAVNWLVDANVVKGRSSASRVFNRLVKEEIITLHKDPAGASKKTSCYYKINDDPEESRQSFKAVTIHSETNTCKNCKRSYLAVMTMTPGYCSIDCKTNAVFSQADKYHATRICA